MPDKILVEIIGEHLPYEIDVLRLTYKELERVAKKSAAKGQEEQAYRYALIEAFCVHARSLIDFFADKRHKPSDVIASDFTVGFVTALDVAKEPFKSMRVKLNKQIFHLTKDRAIIDAKKFDVGIDGTTVLKLIEPEIAKFAAALKSEFKSFKCATGPIAVGLPFSACTAKVEQMTIIEFGPTAPARRT
ncbi:hypothetical protein [Bradyrhizobium sp. SZCCHNR1075]|uniref:hypothetical protein n=1 Tax=Bradyrhizobium sp. SZCCHNR1075 TaxID=3057362 RepID=UPI0028E53315|nr:hypothetical protein [Bradyrhizobium sp. SZCCHNR1075]